jgi:hypothetical protein
MTTLSGGFIFAGSRYEASIDSMILHQGHTIHFFPGGKPGQHHKVQVAVTNQSKENHNLLHIHSLKS